MKLTDNFSLAELIHAGSASRLGLPSTHEQYNPSPQIIANLTALAKNVLQPLRDHFGKSITVTSGYRSPIVNKAVKGSKTSDHMEGMAGDLQLWIDGKNRNQDLFDAVLKLKLPFKQMIDEFGTEDDPAWIHISFDAKNNKRQCLRARKVNGQTAYTPL